MCSTSQEEPPVASREERNWAELPQDVLSIIFKKIGAIEILMGAQLVCRPWRQLSLEPGMWRIINMTTLHGDLFNELDMEGMAKEAVNRSQGQLEEFWAEYFGSDDLLRYIADRTSLLRCLRLISAYGISDEGLAETVSRFPLLEELEITSCSFSQEVCKTVGQACPHLKCFRLNAQGCRYNRLEDDNHALGIANNMTELCRLQLVGNTLTNEGLMAILDKCIHLESLDLRCCFNVNLDASLRAKCAKLKDLRLPNDPTDDYVFVGEIGGDDYFDEDDYYQYGSSEINMMYDDMFFDYSDISEGDFPPF